MYFNACASMSTSSRCQILPEAISEGPLVRDSPGHCVVSFLLRTGLIQKVMKCPDITERLLTDMLTIRTDNLTTFRYYMNTVS